MDIKELNRAAVNSLLADAEFALALTDCEDVRGNKEIVEDVIADAQRNYIDLMRRRRPLILTDQEESAFLTKMEQLKARLEFYGRKAR